VDAPTYAGRPPAGASPTLLRLAGAGVAVAVLRHGMSLPDALGGLRARAVGWPALPPSRACGSAGR